MDSDENKNASVFAAEVTTRSHKELIEDSWRRCKEYGLTHNSVPQYGVLGRGGVSALLEEHQLLVNTTQKEVLPYYDHILSNSNCLIVLADRRGHVLNTWGEQRFTPLECAHGLVVGNRWTEMGAGTNAIGTAIATGAAVQVGRDEHFLRANRFMVGSAAPIFNTQKEMVGVLDISSDAYLPQDHTLGMVKLMTLSVENRLIHNAFQREHLLITFNTNIAALESPWSGLVVIDEDGRIISANRRAEVMLAHDLALANIEDIFNCKLRELRHHPEGMPMEVSALGKYRMHLMIKRPPQAAIIAPDYRKKEKPAPVIVEEELPDDVIPFQELEHGDERVARMAKQANRIMEKDIPILIHGETGSGKEIFVRSLHYHSSRKAFPLVAVNCAAIPAELVESELFGYEKGAFTGASNKGSIGLIRKAHRGTLFLDEIGEMPLKVQARLLRVLQERCVTPLGSTETFPVDIKLISATNRVLKEEVKRGAFREDLYYRISGLNLELPPLRERADKAKLIEYVHGRLTRSAGETYHPLSADVLAMLADHPWPGNVRQLISILSVALAMADGDPIEDWHIPDDFYDDLNGIGLAEPNGDSLGEDADGFGDGPAIRNPKEELEAKIVRLYREYGGNVSQTAKAAGVSRNTVYKYIR
ncbi:sigma-54-dependent Fis family transcriptional regulator [Hahella aquimaris]|uniref:sigma-54-dependent Fis family transcriptional regulator n=1 Tax=Hahella sp. HNIBRBA332 TaxID=3015983 RepID=UPI00273AF151|nr:sigma-54-dependent Fis family transcriptional regulator [Hahella sp. HNIBRBA332]WLQ13132.1 sigma-54-dependent Fis family transcriptional regulator [Hahella sp. HNIBRBA332]